MNPLSETDWVSANSTESQDYSVVVLSTGSGLYSRSRRFDRVKTGLTSMTMTLQEAKALLRGYGVTITKRDGEFRVNFAGGLEATASYTNDIDDAVGTGIAMVERAKETEALEPRVYAVTFSFNGFVHVCVFSSLEKAQAWVEKDRNPECNPKPFEWHHCLTDMDGVETWETKSVTFSGGTEEIVITQYPLDKTPDELHTGPF
jgi:hypothetical protein